MSTPRIVPPKSKRLTFSLPVEIFTTLHAIARHYEVNATEVIRQLLVRERDALISEGWTPPSEPTDEDDLIPSPVTRQLTLPFDEPAAAPVVEPDVAPLPEALPAREDAPQPVLAPPAAVPEVEPKIAAEPEVPEVEVDDHVSVERVPPRGVRGGRTAVKVNEDELDAILAAV